MNDWLSMWKLWGIVILIIPSYLSAQQKIVIHPDQVYSLAIEGAPDALFDKQLQLGDPEKGVPIIRCLHLTISRVRTIPTRSM